MTSREVDQEDLGRARRIAEDFVRTNPRATDPVVTDVVEHADAFVAYWTTAAFLRTGDVADSQGPGTGPLAVPKSGGRPQYLGSRGLDVELHRAGLGPEPAADQDFDWGP